MAPLQSGAEDDGCLGWLQKRSIGCKKLSFMLSWRNRYLMLPRCNDGMYVGYYEDKLCQKPMDVIRPGPAARCVVYHERCEECTLLLRTRNADRQDRCSGALRTFSRIVDRENRFSMGLSPSEPGMSDACALLTPLAPPL
ncbi:hypothetical_protein [Leishmania infantum]|uniref:Hypothetical_protein n=1 Tax=Leishmania infantum TaxID=5671 RepID=A0A6L0XG89_LEIIN|nr:hypothetical_protein [Leishmania infantum]SUZ42847.1 hypothetical_protein [Leishmania infantum]